MKLPNQTTLDKIMNIKNRVWYNFYFSETYGKTGNQQSTEELNSIIKQSHLQKLTPMFIFYKICGKNY